jgi:hypothetical protein
MGKHRWKGELAKPIRPQVIRPRGLRVATDTVAKANKEMEALYRQAIGKEYLRKLGLLMDEYGITDKTDFFNLALALAIEHVPGFGINPTPLRLEEGLVVQDNREGRPPEWPLKRLNKLLSAVEETRKKQSLSTDREALSVLAQRAEWSRPANHQGSPEQWLKTLKNRLAEARRFYSIREQGLKKLENSLEEARLKVISPKTRSRKQSPIS